ncbi:MAG: quinol:cytochrome C oxidoreductase [Phycisphaerales bacterium]
MSQIAAHHTHSHDDHGHHHADLSDANVMMPPGAAAKFSMPLLVIGLVGVVITVVGGFALGLRHALAAYHVGAMTALAMGLGGMFFVLLFHLMGAGWAVTLRRQFENLMSLAPIAAIMVLPVLVIDILAGGQLFAWLGEDARKTDTLLQGKAGYLSPMFFTIRVLFYILVWAYLAKRLRGLSIEQDRSGDKWLSNRARFTSSWGMLIFALTTAFAAFDWLKSVDYRFFSTMWGVYYFAGAAGTAIAVVIIIVAMLRGQGRLKGLVTDEHAHDLAKILFAFTVFWAYIAFSQYFLIWYANIPEETAFYNARKTGGWQYLSAFICFGHFIVPFYLLLWRRVRRTFGLLAFMAMWAILMEVVDLAWIVRPMVYAGAQYPDKIMLSAVWLDLAGALGPICLFLGLLARRVCSGVLIPIRDPRLKEALAHKNYV